ncbi:MAG: LysR family transcriptional regulator, partial [Rhodococcus sp.]|nr:LysR family transcriptional regulator [Rhodococcus sp. (in: high G+C Gram-positive bacteria)]
LAIAWVRKTDVAQHALSARLLGADRLYAVSTGEDTTPVRARDVVVLVDDDTTSWYSWNVYAEEFARDTGAQILRINDGGITGPAFFDHIRAVGRPVVNSPKGQTITLPSDLTARPMIDPAAIWTWSLLCRENETRPAVLAAVDALTRGVTDLGIHEDGRWLPMDDPYRRTR